MAGVQFRFSVHRVLIYVAASPVVARPCNEAARALRRCGQPTRRLSRRPASLRWARLLVTSELPISEELPAGRVRPERPRGHSALHPSATLPGEFGTEPGSVRTLPFAGCEHSRTEPRLSEEETPDGTVSTSPVLIGLRS